jgi:hypothetical protein
LAIVKAATAEGEHRHYVYEQFAKQLFDPSKILKKEKFIRRRSMVDRLVKIVLPGGVGNAVCEGQQYYHRV